ncbi:hypothetical protein GOP47_0007203 [Adiantum capillus-veneris]|uniref:GRF-type domain-containing protein n=1 Tax=Adiantum capillus-veneris TaxID=13818 RepID=A0A9D4ZJ32_ADICA|nr:hypothetical protein GOP47_0007203 [Adiantum capillus-veneris]
MDAVQEQSRKRLCDCGRQAVEKVAGPRSPNQGLRYLCCDRFVFFGKKKNYCSFFEWIDPPRITQEQKREARVGKRQRKEDNLESAAFLPANNTENALQVNKDDAELETINHQDAINAFESSIGALNSANHSQDVCGGEDAYFSLGVQTENGQIEDLSGAQQQHSSPTHGINCKTDRRNFEDTTQPNIYVGQVTNFHVVQAKECTANINHMQSDTNGHDISETPDCLCSRAALLKTVKSRGPNQGLRFWVCSNSRPFYVKKERVVAKDGEGSCKFFRWIDTPLEKSDKQKTEEKQRRKENRKRRELSILS